MKELKEYTEEVLVRSRAIKAHRFAMIRRAAFLAPAVLLLALIPALWRDLKPEPAQNGSDLDSAPQSSQMLITVEYGDGRKVGRFSDLETLSAYFDLLSLIREQAQEQNESATSDPGGDDMAESESSVKIIYCDEQGETVCYRLRGDLLRDEQTGERFRLTQGQSEELRRLFNINE